MTTTPDDAAMPDEPRLLRLLELFEESEIAGSYSRREALKWQAYKILSQLNYEYKHRATLPPPDAEKVEAWVKAEPHEDYECLKRQFISLRSMVNSLGQQLSFYQKKSYETGEQHLSALKESLESERSMNAALTEELAALSSPQTPADLIDAARAVIARWDTPAWKESEPTADVINRLRRAADAVPPPQPDPRAEAMGMMVEALHMASEEVCIACCPSVWKTKDGYPGHSAECKAITEALSHPAVKPFIKGRG